MLDDSLATDCILIFVLNAERLGVFSFVCFQLVVVKFRGNGEMYLLALGAEIDSSAHVAYLLDGHALVKQSRDAEQDILAHSVGKYICAAIHQNRAADVVRPIVVVRKAAE